MPHHMRAFLEASIQSESTFGNKRTGGAELEASLWGAVACRSTRARCWICRVNQVCRGCRPVAAAQGLHARMLCGQEQLVGVAVLLGKPRRAAFCAGLPDNDAAHGHATARQQSEVEETAGNQLDATKARFWG